MNDSETMAKILAYHQIRDHEEWQESKAKIEAICSVPRISL